MVRLSWQDNPFPATFSSMRKTLPFLLFILTFTAFCWSALPLMEKASSDLKKRLPNDENVSFEILGEPLFSRSPVGQFYENRDFKLAWSDENGVSMSAVELLNTLQK